MELQQTFPDLEVTHLSKIGSGHCPMLLKCDIESTPIKKSFRFLNFWVKHASFKDVVRENWNADFSANPFVIFNYKLKTLKKALSTWSRATFEDVFQKIASLEEVVLVHERKFEAYPTQMNRERLQKFKDGDRNKKFFHAQVNGRRKRLKLKRIKNSLGNWIEEDELIAKESVNFYKEQFCESVVPTAIDILNHVHCLVDMDQNENLMSMPTREEVKLAVFGLNRDSAGGPYGFTGAFYHTCWEIIEEDVFAMVMAFFCGQQLPKCVTHTNLVLLPKKKEVNTFADMRPISLSNFVNKIFSRMIHDRLVGLLPELISEEQAGFVKGRSIVENLPSVQDEASSIPAYHVLDTRFEGELAKNIDKDYIVDADFEKIKSNEKVNWKGGKLWADQTEEDSKEGEIPYEIQSGTGQGGIVDVAANSKLKGSAKVSKKQLTNPQVQAMTDIIVPLNPVQLQNKNNDGEQAMTTTQENTGVVATEGAKKLEVLADHANKDLDEDSTPQNFLNVARQGDLSPRHIEKVKSVAKGRKKQIKKTSTVLTGGEQTRRTLTESQNQ
nr:uncharacterized protein LOC104085557 [Nicotiana tomentosiformis]